MKYRIERNTGEHRQPYKDVQRMSLDGGVMFRRTNETTYGCDACRTIQQRTRAQLAAVRCIPAQKDHVI